MVVIAHRRGRLVPVTPASAQQRGVLPNWHRQHDPKYSCSKHMNLGLMTEQERSQRTRDENYRNYRISMGLVNGDWWDFSIWCRKSRGEDVLLWRYVTHRTRRNSRHVRPHVRRRAARDGLVRRLV